MLNKNVVKCPIHGLHYDQTKQDGCALCLKMMEKKKQQEAKPKSGRQILLSVFIGIVVGVGVWALLWFLLPPQTVQEQKEGATAELFYEVPSGFAPEVDYRLEVHLDRMGLRDIDSPWKIKDRFVYVTGNTLGDNFIEYIQILEGPGAYYVSPSSMKEIEKHMLDIKPTSLTESKATSSEVIPIGDTQGVSTMVTYKDRDKEYVAQLLYIPAGDKHYIITMAAMPADWSKYLSAFDSFMVSLSGGMQGKGEAKSLPAFLTSPHRATMVGILAGIITMWVVMWMAFRKQS